jgi:hypothetical protein
MAAGAGAGACAGSGAGVGAALSVGTASTAAAAASMAAEAPAAIAAEGFELKELVFSSLALVADTVESCCFSGALDSLLMERLGVLEPGGIWKIYI